jgi:hypothetical protein
MQISPFCDALTVPVCHIASMQMAPKIVLWMGDKGVSGGWSAGEES